MKKLLDDKEVPAKGYYYLLDWNERDNWKTICEIFPDSLGKLCLLTIDQYIILFKVATLRDLKELKTNIL